jgi:hypothetical protein
MIRKHRKKAIKTFNILNFNDDINKKLCFDRLLRMLLNHPKVLNLTYLLLHKVNLPNQSQQMMIFDVNEVQSLI